MTFTARLLIAYCFITVSLTTACSSTTTNAAPNNENTNNNIAAEYTTFEDDKREVFFAGISYLGEASKLKQRYPHVLALNTFSEKRPSVDRVLEELTTVNTYPHLKLNNGLANLKDGESIVVSLAIELERVIIEEIRSGQKLYFEVGAQLMFMDFETMSLITSYPVRVTKNVIKPVGQDLSQVIDDNFKSLYLGSPIPANAQINKLTPEASMQQGTSGGLLNRTIEVLKQVQLLNTAPLRFQVDSLELTDSVRTKLPPDTQFEDIEHYLAQHFTRNFAQTYEVNALPFSKGHTVGNKMMGQFANGDIYQLDIPESDYTFDMKVLDIKKVTKGAHILFASRLSFALTHTASEQTEIAGKFHYSVPKFKNYKSMDETSAYEDATEELFLDIIEQLSKPSKEWHKRHSNNHKKSYQEFKQVQELLNYD